MEALHGEPNALAGVVRGGYFDAPYLAGNTAARDTAVTVVEGGCHTVDSRTGVAISEITRLLDQ